jgi:hypothetical protein
MDRGDLDAVLDQLAHDRSDLGVEQDKVAHHHHAAVRRLERRPAAKCQAGPDGDAIDGDLKVGAREAVAMDVAGDGCTAPHCGIDLLPIDVLSVCCRGACHRSAERQ